LIALQAALFVSAPRRTYLKGVTKLVTVVTKGLTDVTKGLTEAA
jgi:hypothetical protein